MKHPGFFTESALDRSSGGGRDTLSTEQLSGTPGLYKVKWKVTSKQFAILNRYVNDVDEPNILVHVRGLQADGPIVFYSTIPSTGFN